MEWQWIVLFVLIIVFGIVIVNNLVQINNGAESIENRILELKELIGFEPGNTVRGRLSEIWEGINTGVNEVEFINSRLDEIQKEIQDMPDIGKKTNSIVSILMDIKFVLEK